MMIVYTSQGVELFDTKNKDVYKEGTFGKIYHDGDKCYKVFNNAELFKIDPFLTLDTLSLPNFYRIMDFLYNNQYIFTGYTSKFIKEDHFNILSDKNYFLRGVNNIHDGIIAFTNNHFEVSDLHVGNILVNKEDMTMIDVDNYKRVDNDPYAINMYRYKQLIKRLIYKYLIRYNVTDIMGANELLKELMDEDSDNIDHLNKVLSKVNRPVDYFNKVIK